MELDKEMDVEMEVTQTKRTIQEPNIECMSQEEIAKKRQKTSEEASPEDSCLNMFYPIQSKNNTACVVTLYDVEDGAVKLNEIIETVGFLWHGAHSDVLDEEEPSIPPLVPRLHAVTFKKIVNSNPLVGRDFDMSKLLLEVETLRSDLHLALSQLFLGDALAADYLICNLLSSVYVRQDFLALGKLCINFSNIPEGVGFGEGFYSIINQLVTKSHYLPFSVESMNTLSLLPEKDYEKNRLKSGVLQLSNRTFLVLDETKMKEGRLNETGVKNIKALNDVTTFQRLPYNFRYHEMEFPTDIPVIILSEGRSILRSDIEVLVERADEGSMNESVQALREFLKEPLLTKLRQFVSVCSTIKFDIPPHLLQEVIEKDYVKMRQDPDMKTTVDDLHTLLVLARLLSLSYGKEQMCQEMWRKAVAMETQRKLRINAKRAL